MECIAHQLPPINYSIFESCKLCCKCTVHCNINFEGTFCSMQDSLSCLPSTYNTYMYMHEPYQCIYSVLSVLPSLVHSVQMVQTLTQKTVSHFMLVKQKHLSHSLPTATLLKKGMKLLD